MLRSIDRSFVNREENAGQLAILQVQRKRKHKGRRDDTGPDVKKICLPQIILQERQPLKTGKWQYALGQIYYTAYELKKDDAKAAKWYRSAANLGHATAQYLLGNICAEGYGVKKDERESVRWYRAAADQGHVKALFFLGSMYEHGQGVDVDYSEMEKWYLLAAEKGDVAAQCALARMYATGQHLKPCVPQALRLLGLSAAQGCGEAIVGLERLSQNRFPLG